jgi:hypothetical protein
MTEDVFIGGMELELKRRGLAFTYAEVRAFTQEFWPLVDATPDMPRWVDAFHRVQREAKQPAADFLAPDLF